MNRLFFSAAITSLLAFNLSAQDNLVQNPCFLDTNSNVWVFRTNGATATRSFQVMQANDGTIISRKCKIEITATGDSEDAPQLSQSGIALEEGQGYTLSFLASSSRAGSVRAIISTDGLVLTDSTSGLLNTTATSKKHVFDFFVENNVTNATLQLNMGMFDGATNIALDSIFLIKKSEPTIRAVAPSSQDRWISNTEQQIVWKNSGVLDKVKIEYSTDNGTSWNSITRAATNQNSFWWKIPSDVFGNACKILISSVDGLVADTSDEFRILQSSSVIEGEMIRNGDFLDTTEWQLSSYSPATANGKFENDQFVISIDTVGTEPWQVKLEQRNLVLQMGKTYRLQFDAYASRQRDIFGNIGEQDSPYRSAFGEPIAFSIGTEKSPYIHYFNLDSASFPEGINLNDIRVEFNCGNETGIVYIDNVSLIESDEVNCLITKPTNGSFLRAGSEFNIKWTDETALSVNLDYSLDSGLTWNSIADTIANLQAYLWIVPAQSSPNCQIRLRNAENDSVLGVSAIFQINKFGSQVKFGELVSNGSFSNNLAGWHTVFSGADGQGIVDNGVFSIDASDPGNSLSTIILSQGEMNVLGGTEYILSFSAFANGTRGMTVKVFGDDSVAFLDTTINVPNVMEEISLKLTPTIDAVSKIEFHIGGSHAGVFIDDISFHNSAWTNIVNLNRVVKSRTVAFSVQSSGHGSVCFLVGKNVQGQIAVYNLNGSLIRMLKISEKVLWDGKDSRGSSIARGTYVARLKSNFGNKVNKFVMR